MAGRWQRWLHQAGDLPGVRQWREHRFDRAFAAGRIPGACRGVYADHASASASAPASHQQGYDNVDGAGMYRDRLNRVYASDYPMMFWLQKALAAGARQIHDLGGHIGLSYYGYRRMLDWPADLRWTVHDLPAVMAAGRREAQTLDPARQLDFSDDFAAAAQADVLFTAGCLQYLEQTLAQRLASLPTLPPRVLVNLLPLHPAQAYWTVQSLGSTFCPYRIQHEQRFFAELEALGYVLEDRWENPDKHCWIAFDPAHSLDRYHGAALRLR